MTRRKFYHYTSKYHVPLINRAGVITLTQGNNVPPGQTGDDIPVVWLHDQDLFETPPMLLSHGFVMKQDGQGRPLAREPITVDKGEWRYIVELEEAKVVSAKMLWDKTPIWWVEALSKAAGDDIDHWFATKRAIGRENWRAVQERVDGVWLTRHFYDGTSAKSGGAKHGAV